LKKLIVVFLPFILLSLFALNRIWDYFGERIEIDTTIFIRKNSGLSRIVAELENVGAVKYPILFRLVLEAMMRKRGVRYIKYGEYTLDKEDSLSSIIDKLINGRIFYRSITIPEGLSNKSIFALLEKNEFLSGEIAGKEDIAEGSLLAETYYF
jgi:cell division protein YceG involved in septum cleavage